MDKLKTVHGWHLLTLVLAFVAGGALMAHVPDLISNLGSNKPIELTRAASADVVNVAAGESATSPSASTNSAQSPGSVPTAEAAELPLFWQNEIDDLRQEALAARDEITELRESVGELSDTIDAQEILLAQNLNATSSADSSAAVAANSAPSIDEFGNFRRRRNGSSDLDVLLQAGVSSELATSIQQQQDQRTLARLELLDQASREGWTGTDRLDDELEALDEASPSLRDELGDEAYDRYLFSAGSSNRVGIASVIAGSTADIAGLQVGDIIMRYASERMFTMQELRDATREGVRNEPILLEVERDQQPIALEAVRGPLGVTMTGSRVEP